MKINGNAIRPGNILLHKDRLFRVVTVNHVKPGKGGAYAQTSLKDVRSGSNLQERFRSDAQVETARIEDRSYQFLYKEGDTFIFMNNESYEQVTIEKSFAGEYEKFLKEGMEVTLGMFEDEVISLRLADTIALEVIEADPVVKGQTASSSSKSATLEGDIKVQVPTHIVAGDKIVINTSDSSFVERVK